jgi:hypothetical protein
VVLSFAAFLDQAEDADHPSTVFERHRAELYGHTCPGGRNQVAGCLSCRDGAQHLLGEQLAGAPGFFGRDDRGVVTPADITEKPLGCWVDPSHNA